MVHQTPCSFVCLFVKLSFRMRRSGKKAKFIRAGAWCDTVVKVSGGIMEMGRRAAQSAQALFMRTKAIHRQPALTGRMKIQIQTKIQTKVQTQVQVQIQTENRQKYRYNPFGHNLWGLQQAKRRQAEQGYENEDIQKPIKIHVQIQMKIHAQVQAQMQNIRTLIWKIWVWKS